MRRTASARGASRSGLRVASAQAWRRRATSTSFIRPVRTSAVRVSAASVQPAARSSGQRSAEVSVAGARSSAGAGVAVPLRAAISSRQRPRRAKGQRTAAAMSP
ncbi:hypothetical protein AN221_07835 [Streptomyces nanshensis]|uniref:Uncharacterized protein n=1 Tax=Streptomyces nanshensis TaxID=518642 RepID=A0A1E7LYG3_9ACTN|nr:hypothetical protein AN221_07835 [Streptomyces nanshensis]